MKYVFLFYGSIGMVVVVAMDMVAVYEMLTGQHETPTKEEFTLDFQFFIISALSYIAYCVICIKDGKDDNG